MSAPQLLKQTEALKNTASETTKGSTEAWIARQTLQDIYQKVLILDLEYALDKKVEQDLWNFAFKTHINMLQTQAKDRQNVKRVEAQCSLDLFLQTASGFYLQLLQEICSSFHLNLPFRRKSTNIGILSELGPSNSQIRQPKKTTAYYICQHCLVHLGDIARYRQETEQAQTYYKHAAQLVPYNGQPYNQLAILEAAKGNKLAMIFYYVRATAVKHPFPVASTNMEKLLQKLAKDSIDTKGKLSLSETITSFLQMLALLHLSTGLPRAKELSERLVTSLPVHVTSMSVSSHQLVQMIGVALYSVHHALSTEHVDLASSNGGGGGVKSPRPGDGDVAHEELLSSEEKAAYDIAVGFVVSMLELLLLHTPKHEMKARDYHTLPSIRLLLLWIHTDPSNIVKKLMAAVGLWVSLSKLLNNLQSHIVSPSSVSGMQQYVTVPLQEDKDLQGFLPIAKAHENLGLDFSSQTVLTAEMEIQLRCQRIVEQGLWICEEFPSLNLLNVQKLKSGRFQFSTPLAQVRIAPGAESGKTPDRKASQNVAIQAILQNKAKKSVVINEPPTVADAGVGPAPKDSRDTSKAVKIGKEEASPGKADAGVMAHSVGREPHQQPPVDVMPKNIRPPISATLWHPGGGVQSNSQIPSYPWHGDGSPSVRMDRPSFPTGVTPSMPHAQNNLPSQPVSNAQHQQGFNFGPIGPAMNQLPPNQMLMNAAVAAVAAAASQQSYQNPTGPPFPGQFPQYRSMNQQQQQAETMQQFLAASNRQSSASDGSFSKDAAMQAMSSAFGQGQNQGVNFATMNSGGGGNFSATRPPIGGGSGAGASGDTNRPRLPPPSLPYQPVTGLPLFNLPPPPMSLTALQSAAALTAAVQQQQQRMAGGQGQGKDPMVDLPSSYMLQTLFGQTAASQVGDNAGFTLERQMSGGDKTNEHHMGRVAQFDMQNAVGAQRGFDARHMTHLSFPYMSERSEVPKPDSPTPADRAKFYPGMGHVDMSHQSGPGAMFSQSAWTARPDDDKRGPGYAGVRPGTHGHVLPEAYTSSDAWNPSAIPGGSGGAFDYSAGARGAASWAPPANMVPDNLGRTMNSGPGAQGLFMENQSQSALRKLLEQQKGHRQPETR